MGTKGSPRNDAGKFCPASGANNAKRTGTEHHDDARIRRGLHGTPARPLTARPRPAPDKRTK